MDLFHEGDCRLEGHDGSQINFLQRLSIGRTPVKHYAWSYHRMVVGCHEDHRCGIAAMNSLEIYSLLLQFPDNIGEPVMLKPGEFFGTAGVLICNCKMSKDPCCVQAGKVHRALDLRNAFAEICCTETDPAHSGIYLYMYIYRNVSFYSSFAEFSCIFCPENGLSDPHFKQVCCIFRRSISQDQDRF